MTRSDDKPLLVSKSAKCGVKMQLCGVFRLSFVSRTNCFRWRVLLAEICHTGCYVQQQIDQLRPDTFPLVTMPSEHIIGDAGRRLAFVQAQKATIGRDRRLRYNWAPRINQDDQYSFAYVAPQSSRLRKCRPSTADRKITLRQRACRGHMHARVRIR